MQRILFIPPPSVSSAVRSPIHPYIFLILPQTTPAHTKGEIPEDRTQQSMTKDWPISTQYHTSPSISPLVQASVPAGCPSLHNQVSSWQCPPHSWLVTPPWWRHSCDHHPDCCSINVIDSCQSITTNYILVCFSPTIIHPILSSSNYFIVILKFSEFFFFSIPSKLLFYNLHSLFYL